MPLLLLRSIKKLYLLERSVNVAIYCSLSSSVRVISPAILGPMGVLFVSGTGATVLR